MEAGSAMTDIRITRRMGHRWRYLFALVLNVERYPGFVPHCRDVRVLSRDAEDPARTIIVSRMTVGWAALQVGYANRTVAEPELRSIKVDAIDGPFRYLHVVWEFKPEGEDRTVVVFSAGYEFSNPILSALASRLFGAMFADIVTAFERRADEIAAGAAYRRVATTT